MTPSHVPDPGNPFADLGVAIDANVGVSTFVNLLDCHIVEDLAAIRVRLRYVWRMKKTDYLILPLLQAFCWFDDGLQAYLDICGWDHITRPQSMVMISVLSGQDKPSVIARSLGISRQAAHVTILQLAKLGMIEITADASDGRAKVVVVSKKGRAMRADADEAVKALTIELRSRIGSRAVNNLFEAFRADWGDVPKPRLQSTRLKRSPLKQVGRRSRQT